MSNLPKIFHTNGNFITNNKNSFNSFDKKNEVVKSDSLLKDNDLIKYFNKEISITLKNGDILNGILISKRNDKILLDTGVYILINEILNIK